MILVTTAGKVGAEAARLLAARSEQVRVLVHHQDELVPGHLADDRSGRG